MYLYEMQRGRVPKRVVELQGHEGSVSTIKFSNGGDKIISGGEVLAQALLPMLLLYSGTGVSILRGF